MSNLRRDSRQLAREKALFRYTSALERGDFETVAAVLHEAENDAVLERMILEVNATLASEIPTAPRVVSSNGRHSHTSFDPVEEHMMTISAGASRAQERYQPRIQDRRLPLIAALLALVMFGAIGLFASQMGPNDPTNTSAALQGLNSQTPTPAPSRTATRQASATFAATRLPSRTPTPTMTFTPTPVMTTTALAQSGLMPISINSGIIASADTVNLRSEPGLDYAVIATLMPGTKLTITALTNEEWTEVQLENGSIGWVASVNIAYDTELMPTVPPPDTGGWLGAPNTDLLDFVCQIAGASGPANGIAVYDAPLSEANLIGYLPPSGYYSIFA
ncbi:MAG: SH3 domain-containing protein, partial [Burkholderiales bacterium]|nr:SH3 domain-containing protein [Anaerolineae bacterium]